MLTDETLDNWLDIRDRSRALRALYEQYAAAHAAGDDMSELTALYDECIGALVVDIADFKKLSHPVTLVADATKSLPLQVAQDVDKRLKAALPR